MQPGRLSLDYVFSFLFILIKRGQRIAVGRNHAGLIVNTVFLRLSRMYNSYRAARDYLNGYRKFNNFQVDCCGYLRDALLVSSCMAKQGGGESPIVSYHVCLR